MGQVQIAEADIGGIAGLSRGDAEGEENGGGDEGGAKQHDGLHNKNG